MPRTTKTPLQLAPRKDYVCQLQRLLRQICDDIALLTRLSRAAKQPNLSAPYFEAPASWQRRPNFQCALELQIGAVKMQNAPQPLPRPLSFYFSIKSIEPDFSVQARRQTKPPDCYWEPPTDKRAFKVIRNTGFFSWVDGMLQAAPTDRNHLRHYRTTSMFWCTDRQAFLHVPYDCTKFDVGKPPKGEEDGIPLDWNKLSFDHQDFGQNECISKVGYRREKTELGANGPPAWMPELLPKVYQFHKTTNYQQCHLAGDLSVIIGLAAFSTTPNTMLTTIQSSFHRPAGSSTEWRPHGRVDEGRTFQRGLVVQVAYDARLSTMPDILRGWEEGRYGPIIP